MNGITGENRNPRVGRMLSKVTRRVIGFVLMTFTIGLTTCSVLDAVNEAPQSALEQPVRS